MRVAINYECDLVLVTMGFNRLSSNQARRILICYGISNKIHKGKTASTFKEIITGWWRRRCYLKKIFNFKKVKYARFLCSFQRHQCAQQCLKYTVFKF